MIKYLGSKRKLIPKILQVVADLQSDACSVIDLFCGTSRVGYALKQQGFQVFANDLNAYAYTLAKCHVEANKSEIQKPALQLIKEFNAMKGSPGYFTQTFCENARFFHPKNGGRIDAIRDKIVQKNLPRILEAVLLVSLMEAADRVDSTCGLQMAYLKSWAKRAHNDMELRMPVLADKGTKGQSKAFQLNAALAANELKADIAYLDPPYNQHSYLSNYHIWETLVKWDSPEVYGIAQKRRDCQSKKSVFNKKKSFLEAFEQVIGNLNVKFAVISFNNEGFVNRLGMEELLGRFGKVSTQVIDYKRYIGAQIGIYNLKGNPVGELKSLYNKEYLYILEFASLADNRANALKYGIKY